VEGPRNEEIRQKIRRILGLDIHEERNADTTGGDAVYMLMVGDARIPLCIAEFKKIFGEGGCDPSIQTGITFRRTWILPSVSQVRHSPQPVSYYRKAEGDQRKNLLSHSDARRRWCMDERAWRRVHGQSHRPANY
jgi:hypothetical protein